MRSHGNSGTVRVKFASNLPPHTLAASCRVVCPCCLICWDGASSLCCGLAASPLVSVVSLSMLPCALCTWSCWADEGCWVGMELSFALSSLSKAVGGAPHEEEVQ